MQPLQDSNQKDELYSKFFFDRPVNPIQQPIIGIVGGKLASLNHIYEAITVTGSRAEVVGIDTFSEPVQSTSVMPANSFRSEDRMEIAEKLQELENNMSLVILGVDIILSSNIQIEFEKFLTYATVPVILCGPSVGLLGFNQELFRKSNIVIFADSLTHIKLINRLHIPVRTNSARGIYQLADLAFGLQERFSNIKQVLYDNQNIVSIDSGKPIPQEASMTHFGAMLNKDHDYILGVIASMLAWPLRNLDNFKQRVSNATYLIKNCSNEEKISEQFIKELAKLYNQMSA